MATVHIIENRIHKIDIPEGVIIEWMDDYEETSGVGSLLKLVQDHIFQNYDKYVTEENLVDTKCQMWLESTNV